MTVYLDNILPQVRTQQQLRSAGLIRGHAYDHLPPVRQMPNTYQFNDSRRANFSRSGSIFDKPLK
jgi:hypothetical protein